MESAESVESTDSMESVESDVLPEPKDPMAPMAPEALALARLIRTLPIGLIGPALVSKKRKLQVEANLRILLTTRHSAIVSDPECVTLCDRLKRQKARKRSLFSDARRPVLGGGPPKPFSFLQIVPYEAYNAISARLREIAPAPPPPPAPPAQQA